MVVLVICGGGNGAHVLAGIASSNPNADVRVLTLYADEAERWTKAMEGNDFVVTVNNQDKSQTILKNKPRLVTKDPALAANKADMIVFTVPAFAHRQYLDALKPHIRPGTVLVGLPGQSGFEFEVWTAWGDLAKQCSIMSFESLPWACRFTEFGRAATVIGTKENLAGAAWYGSVPPKADPTLVLQGCLGPHPVLLTRGALLGITLMATNGYIHPSILFGRWHKWDGNPVNEPPLFYNGLDEFSAQTMSSVSDEILAVASSLMKQRPQVDLTNVAHIWQWYLRVYADDIGDKTSLFTTIRTNAAYSGLTHPTTKTDDGKFVPDFKHRYLMEDIPFGLLVSKGIAEVAGVPTPTIDSVISWAQQKMGKEYIVNGKLAGKDVSSTRCPQRYGLTTVDAILGL
uniref:Strombine/alanopine dehydrogenase n=1 Tax=Marphysa sanguinea TaxID=167828 RepID=A0A9I9_MARSA|nr:strombine/alanopine dehydrogenase [Marphysa sanguinea]